MKNFKNPISILMDRGIHYTSDYFKWMFVKHEIIPKYASAYNSTGNSIAERINQTINFVVRCFQGEELTYIENKINFVLTNASHQVMKVSPSELVKGFSELDPLKRKAIINIEKLNELVKSQQQLDNARIYNLRTHHDYLVGDFICVRNNNPQGKLDVVWLGPFEIINVSNNFVIVKMGLKKNN
ncbi:hypothetical protein HERIO_703 [Hepatospora eriocheir]|uniref:Integrase catalytic domain-containing protein n=1 Tax=Hepatospora eriocheir TaxID=1081669 RepID=A0A1X0QCF9_9MICR|nr:hypothetical protein HERIO_703 [Hepatospora eriocheir]